MGVGGDVQWELGEDKEDVLVPSRHLREEDPLGSQTLLVDHTHFVLSVKAAL